MNTQVQYDIPICNALKVVAKVNVVVKATNTDADTDTLTNNRHPLHCHSVQIVSFILINVDILQ